MNNLVSVIVPVYNRENYLRRCIDSILAQTYTNFELLLIDDGSTDNSGKICDEYAERDNRVKVFHKENGGVSSARNVGLDNAKGEYIIFVDSDDWVAVNYVELLLPREGEDLVCCGSREMEAGREIGRSGYNKDEVYTIETIRNFRQCRWGKIYLGPCAKGYRRTIIDKIALRFDEMISYHEDGIFNMFYFHCCNTIRLISDDLYFVERTPHGSLVERYHSERLMSEVKFLAAEDILLGKSFAWFRRKMLFMIVIQYYKKWMKEGNKIERKDAKRRLKETYRCEFFREWIPYIRQHGSLDEKIETYFIGYYKHAFYKPFYAVIKALYKIKNIFKKGKEEK